MFSMSFRLLPESIYLFMYTSYEDYMMCRFRLLPESIYLFHAYVHTHQFSYLRFRLLPESIYLFTPPGKRVKTRFPRVKIVAKQKYAFDSKKQITIHIINQT